MAYSRDRLNIQLNQNNVTFEKVRKEKQQEVIEQVNQCRLCQYIYCKLQYYQIINRLWIWNISNALEHWTPPHIRHISTFPSITSNPFWSAAWPCLTTEQDTCTPSSTQHNTPPTEEEEDTAPCPTKPEAMLALQSNTHKVTPPRWLLLGKDWEQQHEWEEQRKEACIGSMHVPAQRVHVSVQLCMLGRIHLSEVKAKCFKVFSKKLSALCSIRWDNVLFSCILILKKCSQNVYQLSKI